MGSGRIQKLLIIFSISTLSASVFAGERLHEYESNKSDLNASELETRDIMSKLYEINARMYNMSKTRDKTNNKLIDVQSRADNLARSQAELETLIESQRGGLSRRLRALYKTGQNQLMRLIFSTTSSQELHQNLKYMRVITEQDYKLIKGHQINLAKLKQTKQKLNLEVKKLIAVRSLLKQQEADLESEQATKTALLKGIENRKSKVISNLNQIRSSLSEDELSMLNISFFENRGKLPNPVTSAKVTKGFGVIEHPVYGYRLSHKGLLFEGKGDIRSVFDGRVAFVGEIGGYGGVLILDHGDHYYSVYSNIKNLNLSIGQLIKKSEKISDLIGTFYFEIRHFSDAIDPKNWLEGGDKNET